MFSQACVKNSVYKGGVHPLGQTPPDRHPPGQTPPGQTPHAHGQIPPPTRWTTVAANIRGRIISIN